MWSLFCRLLRKHLLSFKQTAYTNYLQVVGSSHILYMKITIIESIINWYLRHYTIFVILVWTNTNAVSTQYLNRHHLWAKYRYTAKAYCCSGFNIISRPDGQDQSVPNSVQTLPVMYNVLNKKAINITFKLYRCIPFQNVLLGTAVLPHVLWCPWVFMPLYSMGRNTFKGTNSWIFC